MAKNPKKKASTASISRSKVVGVRLDPKLRYLAELAARKQRRSLSSFVEWAIEESLGRVSLPDDSGFDNGHPSSIAEEAEQLWDVDEPDRFARLALRYPELLTHEEQITWKLVRENGFLWKGKYVNSQWTWQLREDSLRFDQLREHWDQFKAVARGEEPLDVLPTWKKEESPISSGYDDDIPF
jgi:hypothetical protein